MSTIDPSGPAETVAQRVLLRKPLMSVMVMVDLGINTTTATFRPWKTNVIHTTTQTSETFPIGSTHWH